MKELESIQRGEKMVGTSHEIDEYDKLILDLIDKDTDMMKVILIVSVKEQAADLGTPLSPKTIPYRTAF
jgi:hypothetical protein